MLRQLSTDSVGHHAADVQEPVPALFEQQQLDAPLKTRNHARQTASKAVMGPAHTDQQNRLPQDASLRSPFAAAEVQQTCQRQPQDLDALHIRKRARHVTPEPDSLTHSKLQQLAEHYKQSAMPLLNQSDPVTIHRPTAQRPTSGTACTFGLQAFPSPAVHALHALQQAAATAPPIAVPAGNQNQPPGSRAFVPDSLATAAALAIPMNKSQATDAMNRLQHGMLQPTSSAENRTLQSPAASDSSSSAEPVSDNSQTVSARAQQLLGAGLAPCPNLSTISTQTAGHLPAQPFKHSPTYLATQHVTPAPTLVHSASLAPFTTYGGFPGSFSHATSLPQATTYVVVSGNSPKRAASPSDKYVAALVQDAQGNSQRVTVPASAISTGGPSYVLPATTAIPANPMTSFIGPQCGFGTAPQHSFLPSNPFAQPVAGMGSMFGMPGVWPSMALNLPAPFGMTQPALNAVQLQAPLLPSLHVVQDKSHCMSATANVRIY